MKETLLLNVTGVFFPQFYITSNDIIGHLLNPANTKKISVRKYRTDISCRQVVCSELAICDILLTAHPTGFEAYLLPTFYPR